MTLPLVPVDKQREWHLDRNWHVIHGEILRHKVWITGRKLGAVLSMGE